MCVCVYRFSKLDMVVTGVCIDLWCRCCDSGRTVVVVMIYVVARYSVQDRTEFVAQGPELLLGRCCGPFCKFRIGNFSSLT